MAKINIEDLKCCGNCMRGTHYDWKESECQVEDDMAGDHYCDKWECDLMTQNNRKL